MKTIFQATVKNRFRAKGKWYNSKKGHTGVDLAYKNEDLPSPITGQVVKIARQTEMGLTLYLKDATTNIHIFAHLKKTDCKQGDKVKRGDTIAETDNTGSATSGPHLHYEIIVTAEPYRAEDKIMTRKLFNFSGWNTDPIPYLKDLYDHYGIDTETSQPKEIPEPDWLRKTPK